jgi:hypothetical protein
MRKAPGPRGPYWPGHFDPGHAVDVLHHSFDAAGVLRFAELALVLAEKAAGRGRAAGWDYAERRLDGRNHVRGLVPRDESERKVQVNIEQAGRYHLHLKSLRAVSDVGQGHGGLHACGGRIAGIGQQDSQNQQRHATREVPRGLRLFNPRQRQRLIFKIG